MSTRYGELEKTVENYERHGPIYAEPTWHGRFLEVSFPNQKEAVEELKEELLKEAEEALSRPPSPLDEVALLPEPPEHLKFEAEEPVSTFISTVCLIIGWTMEFSYQENSQSHFRTSKIFEAESSISKDFEIF